MRGLPRTRVSLPATYPRKRGPRAWHTGVRQTAQRLGDRGRTSSRATQRHQPLARRTSLRPPVGTSARRGRTAQCGRQLALPAGLVGENRHGESRPPRRGRPLPGGGPKGPPGGRGPPPRGAGAGSSPSAMESTLVAKSASVLCIERETIAGARAASSGENCGGGGSTSRAITHRDPRSSPISLACSLGTYSDHIARTRGARRGLATGAASGSVAGEGRLTGLAGAVAVGVAGPQSASLSSSLSESWPPPVAPCPMVLLSPPPPRCFPRRECPSGWCRPPTRQRLSLCHPPCLP